MGFNWQLIIDLGILSAGLLIGTLIRSRVKFFQRFLIPNSLTAGFLLLPLFNFWTPLKDLGTTTLENLVYHLLSLSFIAMTLRVSPDRRKKRRNPDILATAATLLTQYSIQSFFGTLLTIILIKTIMPSLFPGFGLFPTLGFSLGPGQAFAIGKTWETMGFSGLADVGLTFAALGFIWASFGGIFLVNYGVKKGWLQKSKYERMNRFIVREGVAHKDQPPESSRVKDYTNPEAIDPLSFNIALVMGTYLLTYLLLQVITWALSFAGTAGGELASNLWGISFIFAGLTALLVKSIMGGLKISYIVDNKRLTRISGFSVDYMVTAAISAISIEIVAQHWMPILILTVVIGVITTFSHIWLSSRIFSDHAFYRSILCYGAVTGTLPTGLALLRVIDPNFETPASRDYMYARGIVFFAAIPIILTANLPAKTGISGSFTVLGLYSIYLVVMAAIYLLLSGRRRFKNPSSLWLNRKRG